MTRSRWSRIKSSRGAAASLQLTVMAGVVSSYIALATLSALGIGTTGTLLTNTDVSVGVASVSRMAGRIDIVKGALMHADTAVTPQGVATQGQATDAAAQTSGTAANNETIPGADSTTDATVAPISDSEATPTSGSLSESQAANVDAVASQGATLSDTPDSAPAGEVSSNQTPGNDLVQTPAASATVAPASTTIQRAITSADGRAWVVRVTFDESAGIPQDATLEVTEINQVPDDYEEHKADTYKDRPLATEQLVSKEAMDERANQLSKALGVQDGERVLSTKYLRVALVKDGAQIVPSSEVKVEVETNAVAPGVSDALKVALLAGDASKQLPVQNLTGTDANGNLVKAPATSRVAVSATELGELCVSVVANEKFSWEMFGQRISVLGASDVAAEPYEISTDQSEVNGYTLVELFRVAVSPEHDYATTLWLATQPAVDNAAEPFGNLLALGIEPGKVPQTLLSKGASGPVEFQSTQAIALEWDSGYRDATLDAGNVTVKGAMPQGTSAQVADATAGQPKPASDELVNVVAYDVSLSAGNEVWQPSDERPVTITISDEEIDATKDIEVCHLADDGSEREMNDSVVDGNAVTFTATDDGTYVVRQRIVRETTLVASDGQSYHITATYDANANIPTDATLAARELEGEELATYEKQAADALAAGEKLYFRAFDISFVDASGAEVEPAAPVDVTIELADAEARDDAKVVHFTDAEGQGAAKSQASSR